MMFDSDIVEIAIGLIFVYFLLSLVASAVTEWISRMAGLRSSNLYDGIENILQDPELIRKFYTHPLITPTLKAYNRKKDDIEQELDAKLRQLNAELEKQDVDVKAVEKIKREFKGLIANKPSYISSRNFALVLLEVAQEGSASQNVKALQEALSKGLPGDSSIERSLLTLVDQASGNFEKTVTNVENWFDDVMDRASGWYARKAQLITLAFAFVVAIGLNADTLTIVHQLSQDRTLRATVVAAADRYVEEAQTDPEAGLEDATTQGLRDELQSLGIPLGWRGKWEDTDGDGRPEEIRAFPNPLIIGQTAPFFLKLLGLIITAMAISLGAPFWFDLLGKISNIRGAGSAPAPAIEPASPPKQASASEASEPTGFGSPADVPSSAAEEDE
jgi:hypothetical protein